MRERRLDLNSAHPDCLFRSRSVNCVSQVTGEKRAAGLHGALVRAGAVRVGHCPAGAEFSVYIQPCQVLSGCWEMSKMCFLSSGIWL